MPQRKFFFFQAKYVSVFPKTLHAWDAFFCCLDNSAVSSVKNQGWQPILTRKQSKAWINSIFLELTRIKEFPYFSSKCPLAYFLLSEE